MKKKINICIATAADYEYVVVLLVSILMNKKIETEICFHFLVSNDFTDEARVCLESLCLEHGCKCCFYSVGNQFDKATTHIPWSSTPTFYRLIIPEVLEKEDKCLYLDADIVVMEDLWELYNADSSDYMVAGVYALAYQKVLNSEEYCKSAELPGIDNYINAGVLLMNLKALREKEFSRKAMELIPKDYPSQDQDIVNKLCYRHIKILPFKYNCMTKYYHWNEYDYEDLYKRDEILESWARPVIIHYADRKKPWKDFSSPLAQKWWYFCKKSPAWDYWRETAESEFVYRSLFDSKKNCGLCDIYKIKQWDNVIVFGAGNVSKKIIWELKKIGIIVDSVIVSKKENNPESINGIVVKAVSEIDDGKKRLPVILAVQNDFRAEVISFLWENDFINIYMIEENGLI